VAQQCRFRLKGAADDPHAPIGGDVLLTRADRQRYRIPIYNLTTGQPLPDIKGEGNLAIHFDNSAFHSLFPDAELAIVRIPKPPDRASPEEIAEHQARMRELVEQGIEIDGQLNEEICGAVQPVRCEPPYAKTTKANPLLIYGEDRPSISHAPTSLQQF